jgi:hypothetical protein
VVLDPAGNLFINASYGVREVAYTGWPALTLNRVTPRDAGDYAVFVSSAEGSITSVVATVTVQVPPTLVRIVRQLDGSTAIRFSGTPNTTNRLWRAASLETPMAWLPISQCVTDPNGLGEMVDAGAVGYPTCFYHISMP